MEKTIQDIQFELMERASFNGFDGEKVVRSLKKHKDLWEGVVMDRASYCFHMSDDDHAKIDLIKLRDISSDEWNVDTLFILPQEGKEEELIKVARRWGADEVDFLGESESGRLLGIGGAYGKKTILRVWWD